MTADNKISPFQLTALLLVCRLFTLITWTQPQVAAGSLWVGLLLGLVVQLLLAVVAMRLSHFLGNKLTLAVGWLYCLAVAAVTAGSCGRLLADSFYSGKRGVTMIVLLVAAAVFAVYLGLAAIARSAPVVTLLALVALVVVVAGAAGGMTVDYLPPITLDWQGVGYTALHSTLTNMELVLLPLLMGYCTKPIKRSAVACWLLASTAVSVVLSLSIMLSLGYYAADRAYPVVELAGATQLLTGRLGTVMMVLWVLLGFLRSSIYLWLGCQLWGRLARPSKGLRLPALNGIVAVAVALMLLTGCGESGGISSKTIVTMMEIATADSGYTVRLEHLDVSGGRDDKGYPVCEATADDLAAAIADMEQQYSRDFYLDGCALVLLSGEQDRKSVADTLEQLDSLEGVRPLTSILLSGDAVLEAGNDKEKKSSSATPLRRLFAAKGGRLDDRYTLKDSIARLRDPRLTLELPLVGEENGQAVTKKILSLQ